MGRANRAVVRGSSPLTRGKRATLPRPPFNFGLIPAHAGKTFGVTLVENCIGAHPRSRGENPFTPTNDTT